MRTLRACIAVMLLVPPCGSPAAEVASLEPPRHLGPPLPEQAATNRAFTGIPSMAVTPQGRLWATWYAGVTPGEDQNNYVVLSTAAADGAPWQEVLVVDPDGEGPVRAFDPELWVSPDGRLFFFWAQMDRKRRDPELGVWYVETATPEAATPAWSAPRRVGDGVMMCKPIALSTGEWALPISLWREHDKSAQIVVSNDKGATWHVRGGCNVPKADRQFDEHMIVERKDGSLWMLVRTNDGIGESVSADRGVTWPDLEPSALLHPPSRFFVRRLASGSLLLVKHGPLDARTGRSHLTAFISKDDGATWTGGLLLDERAGVSYPDGQQTADGTIRIIYDHGRVKDREILLATFREEDAAAGKDVTGAVRLRQVVSKASGGRQTPKPSAAPAGAAPARADADGKPLAAAVAAGADPAPPPGAFAVSARLEEFLGDPLFVPKQQLWEQRGGWGGVIAAADGTFVAFQSPGGPRCKRSLDGGRTWGPDIEIGPDATGGNAIVDESTGDLLYVNPDPGWLYRSRDSGATWSREAIEVKPDGFGNVPRLEGVAAMQCGITLAFGPKRGRLIMPARVMGPKNSNAIEWRPYHYSTAIFSDDGGKVWRTSHPFPVLGTGEAALAELSDGTILYNSREHMSRGNRFLARSEDGGSLWIGALRSAELPDGPRGSSYGLMGGMVRLPVAGRDVLLSSNADTAGGTMPAKVGDSSATARERLTVWASFDGGRTWPVKRLVEEGPSAYSSLGVGRTGTPGAGRIAIIFEGGPRGSHAAVQVATFNLAWLLDGRDAASFLPPPAATPSPAKPEGSR